MIEKSKLQELENQISEKRKELEALKNQRKATQEPTEMVTLDKEIEDAARTLGALERTKKVVTYMPPKPTDKQILLSGLNKYVQEKKEKVAKASEAIRETEKELLEVERSLASATSAGEADKVVTYSTKRDELAKYLEYIKPIRTAAENARTFPDGAIMEAWLGICREKKPELLTLLERIELLANEYRAACNELLFFNGTLLDVRRELGQMAANDGAPVSFYPVLTVGLNVEPLRISKEDGMKPGRIMNNGLGKLL